MWKLLVSICPWFVLFTWSGHTEYGSGITPFAWHEKRTPGECDRLAVDAYSSMAPNATFAFVGGPCCHTRDFVFAFLIMITFDTLLFSLFYIHSSSKQILWNMTCLFTVVVTNIFRVYAVMLAKIVTKFYAVQTNKTVLIGKKCNGHFRKCGSRPQTADPYEDGLFKMYDLVWIKCTCTFWK
jgi:hypothetical protein